jgi:hypothetical protein
MRGRIISLLIAAATLQWASLPAASQGTSSWHLYGGTNDTIDFFSSTDFTRRPDGHVEVWVKGLKKKQVDQVMDKTLKDKERMKQLIVKVMAVTPWIAEVEEVSQEDQQVIVLEEEIANTAEVPPVMRMLFEFDCGNRLMRTLSVYMVKDGRTGQSDKASEWMHIPPESNGSTLAALVCQKPK